jgi:hypothetical protein
MHRLWLTLALVLGLAGTATAAVVSGPADARDETSSGTIMILSEGQSTCGAYNAEPDMQPVQSIMGVGLHQWCKLAKHSDGSPRGKELPNACGCH